MSDVHKAALWMSDIHGKMNVMRKEPFGVGSFVHVVKRGSRGLPIVKDEGDRQRFLLMLAHFNDTHMPLNWYRDLVDESVVGSFKRPSAWPDQEPLIAIHGFCLLDNHFHLLLEEIRDEGIAQFMKRLGVGMVKRFNEKYHERGSLFQGSYRAKTIDDENYLKYVSVYIHVKNAFDVYPDGYERACRNFDRAYAWAQKYPYCSLGDYSGEHTRPLIKKEMLGELFTTSEYDEFAKEMIQQRQEFQKEIREHAQGHFE